MAAEHDCGGMLRQGSSAVKGGNYKLLLVEVVGRMFDNTNLERD
jgi:hypothetical protein